MLWNRQRGYSNRVRCPDGFPLHRRHQPAQRQDGSKVMEAFYEFRPARLRAWFIDQLERFWCGFRKFRDRFILWKRNPYREAA
jgi:hypothetical protein